jgi:hypothetical protein
VAAAGRLIRPPFRSPIAPPCRSSRILRHAGGVAEEAGVDLLTRRLAHHERIKLAFCRRSEPPLKLTAAKWRDLAGVFGVA